MAFVLRGLRDGMDNGVIHFRVNRRRSCTQPPCQRLSEDGLAKRNEKVEAARCGTDRLIERTEWGYDEAKRVRLPLASQTPERACILSRACRAETHSFEWSVTDGMKRLSVFRSRE